MSAGISSGVIYTKRAKTNTAVFKILQPTHCNISQFGFLAAMYINKDAKHEFPILFFFFFNLNTSQITVLNIPRTSSSKLLQCSNKPRLMLSTILPHLFLINHQSSAFNDLGNDIAQHLSTCCYLAIKNISS